MEILRETTTFAAGPADTATGIRENVADLFNKQQLFVGRVPKKTPPYESEMDLNINLHRLI